MDFEGKVGGTAFEGGKGEDMSVELGTGRLIPGFEEQLLGAKSGETREVKVAFPKDYPVDNLKGKDAVFDVAVKQVRIATEGNADDDFAKSLGLDSLDKLKEILRDQQAQELNGLTRTHMKRRLLDQLSDRAKFDVPQSMVDAEYENIMAQLRHEASHESDPEAALKEIESEAADYRRIAERRVRLGLLLSEIGAANGVDITDAEMSRLIAQAASQYQGKDRDRFIQYIQQEPTAAAQLRAPLYEDKVVDFLFSKADVTERKASRAEVEADLESEEGHVHGPGCGHDHEHGEAKPKKPGKAKTEAKKATKAKADAPAKGPGEKASARPRPAKPVKDAGTAKPAAAKAEKPAAKKAAAKKPAKKG
jgi:trigger factor